MSNNSSKFQLLRKKPASHRSLSSMKTLESLDIDIMMVEILARLPVITLLHLKSVCKSLNFLISSRDFTRIYHRQQSLSSSAAGKRLILAGIKRINCYRLDPHSTTTKTTFVFDEMSQAISVIGTSNGLLCIHLSRGEGDDSSREEYWILNPTTRICRPIHTHTLDKDDQGIHNHGFGFDHENLDYIIVVVSNYIDKSAMKTRITRVYSSNKNSWRVIEKTFPTDTMDPLAEGGVLIDNYLLHWRFWAPALGKYRIGCFDICKKRWTDDILLPRFYYDPICKKNCYLVGFGVVDDCLFSTFKDGVENRYDVWVMKEYGVQESWVMLLSIPISVKEEVINPVAWLSSDMILVRQRNTSRFFWYNKVDGGISDAKFDGAPNWGLQSNYMGSRSLVHIPGGQLFDEHFQVT